MGWLIFYYTKQDSSQLISSDNQSKVWPKIIEEKYPSYFEKKQQKFVSNGNKSIRRKERELADQQFQTNAQTGMTQRQRRATRQKLHVKGHPREVSSRGDNCALKNLSNKPSV